MLQTFVYDRVQETTTTSGTGTISLAGAVGGYQSFSSVFASGSSTYYTLVDGSAWEVGQGTVTTGSPWTVSRDILLASSTGSKISLSGGATQVWCDLPANVIQMMTSSQVPAVFAELNFGGL